MGPKVHKCPNDVPRNCRICARALVDTGFEGKSRICVSCWSPLSGAQQRNAKRSLKIMLGGKCNRCDYDRSFAALHFHHIDSSEKRVWRKDRVAISEVRAHPERFELLCANCHAEHHHG